MSKKAYRECLVCQGSGIIDCDECDRSGYVYIEDNTFIECEECGGMGEIVCFECEGTGELQDED